METIVIIGAGASGLACMNELVKTNKYNNYVYNKSDLPPLFNKHCFSACNNFLLKAGSF